MNKNQLILILQELKILKGNLLVAGAIGATEGGVINAAIEALAMLVRKEKVEVKKPKNEHFIDLCSFLLMDADDGHVDIIHLAFNNHHTNLLSGISFLSNVTQDDDTELIEYKESLKWLEDMRSLLPLPTIEISTPSSQDLLNAK